MRSPPKMGLVAWSWTKQLRRMSRGGDRVGSPSARAQPDHFRKREQPHLGRGRSNAPPDLGATFRMYGNEGRSRHLDRKSGGANEYHDRRTSACSHCGGPQSCRTISLGEMLWPKLDQNCPIWAKPWMMLARRGPICQNSIKNWPRWANCLPILAKCSTNLDRNWQNVDQLLQKPTKVGKNQYKCWSQSATCWPEVAPKRPMVREDQPNLVDVGRHRATLTPKWANTGERW